MFQPNWDDPSKTKGVALVDKSLAPGTKLYTHPASADDSKHRAVMQAQIWAQEARTQKAIVKEIGEMVGCANDWEMVEAVRDALANVCVSQSAEYETQADLSLMDDKQAASMPEANKAWASSDPSWLLAHLKEDTIFDTESIGEMLAFAKAAASAAKGTKT
jgi:hypothetical protein